MKKSYPQVIVLLLLFVFLFGFCGDQLPAQAQEIGIKISPVKIDELVKPGQVMERSVKVTNTSPIAKSFYLYLSDFEADGELGQARLIPAGTSDIGLSSWVNISSQAYDFAPGEVREISFKISVPADAAPGGYYGAVEFGTEPPKVKIEGQDKGAAISMAQRTACLILLQVAGEVNEDAEVREFTSDKTFYGTPFDVKFTVRIENKGNNHLKPQGSINIYNLLGKNVGVVRINASNANVLRNSIRKFEEDWSGTMAFGRYKAKLGLSYGTEANLGGQGKKTLYTEYVFWIMPWKIIVPAVLILLLIGLFIAFLLNLYKNKAIKKAMEQMGARQRTYSKSYPRRAADANRVVRLSIMMILGIIIILVLYFIFFA